MRFDKFRPELLRRRSSHSLPEFCQSQPVRQTRALRKWRKMAFVSTPASPASETRERILLTAMDLFRKHGFHNTSLARILQGAGVTKGGFYFHFKSKEELGFAVLKRTRNFWIKNVIAALESEPDARSRIKKMVEIMTRMHRGEIFHGCALLAVLTAEMMESQSEFTERIKGIITDWQKSIVSILEQGKTEGLFKRNMDSEALALILIGCCQGTTMIGHLDPESADYDVVLHNLEKLILEGVA